MTRKLLQLPTVSADQNPHTVSQERPATTTTTTTTTTATAQHGTVPPWARLSSYTPSITLKHHTIPAATGFAFTPKPGSNFRLVDLHGRQVIDFMGWCLPSTSDCSRYTTAPNTNTKTNSTSSLLSPSPSSSTSTSTSHNVTAHDLRTAPHFAASYTRYNIHGLAPPVPGEHLYSNHGEKMFEVVEDTVKCHDMLFMACNPSFYAGRGLKDHRNCAENIAEGVNLWLGGGRRGGKEVGGGEGPGVRGGNEKGAWQDSAEMFQWYDVHDPFNVFQNTPYYSLKALENSRKGDYIEIKALGRCLVALSCCPYAEDGFNGGKATDVGVVWEE